MKFCIHEITEESTQNTLERLGFARAMHLTENHSGVFENERSFKLRIFN